MKILVINRQSSIDGGADRVFKNNLDLLKANGHEVIFFTVNDHSEIVYKYQDYLPKKINYKEIKFKDYITGTINYLYKNGINVGGNSDKSVNIFTAQHDLWYR